MNVTTTWLLGMLLAVNGVSSASSPLWFLPNIWPFVSNDSVEQNAASTEHAIDLSIESINETLIIDAPHGSLGATTEDILDESSNTTTTATEPSTTEATTTETPPTAKADRRQIVRMKPTATSATSSTTQPTTVQPTADTTVTTTTATTSAPRIQPRATEATVTTSTTATTEEECVKYSSDELYKLLTSVGGVNQQFMADTAEQAGRNFIDLTAQDSGALDDSPPSTAPVFVTLANASSLSPPCDARCRQIRQRLTDSLVRIDLLNRTRVAADRRMFDAIDDADVTAVDESAFGCAIDFVPLSNSCAPRGEEALWGHETLCSSCHGVYVLSRWCFPRFFNAVTCNKKDGKCIYDLWTTRAHGTCRSRSLHFSVLRNAGSVECQRWLVETVAMPIACECYLSKSSIWLRA